VDWVRTFYFILRKLKRIIINLLMVKVEIKKGILAISLGSVLLGSIGVFVRMAGNYFEPMTQSFGRIFFAFVFISILNLATGKLKNETFAIKKSDLPYFFLNGIISFSGMAAAFTLSVLYTTITNTYFLLYTAPIFAAILGYVFLRDKITKQIVIAIILSVFGLVFLFNPSSLTSNLVGNLFGLLTGMFFGAYFVITSFLRQRYSAPTITFWTQAIGALGLFPLIFIFDRTINLTYSLSELLPVIAAGLIVFAGYILLNYGLKKVKASVGSILSLFEPLSSVVYGLLFFAELPTGQTLIGASLIIVSIVYLTIKQK